MSFRLVAHKVDLVVLAGYMKLVGDPMLTAFAGRMVNIHPSLLPSFKGLNAQQQALSHMRRLYADHPTASMQCFSATKGTGKAQLLALLLEWLAAPLENTE